MLIKITIIKILIKNFKKSNFYKKKSKNFFNKPKEYAYLSFLLKEEYWLHKFLLQLFLPKKKIKKKKFFVNNFRNKKIKIIKIFN
jgi:hypothetical protein